MAAIGARRRRLHAGQVRRLRRRSLLGPYPGGARRAGWVRAVCRWIWCGVALDIQGVCVYSKGRAAVAFDAKALAGAHEEGGGLVRLDLGAGEDWRRPRLRPDVRLREDQRGLHRGRAAAFAKGTTSSRNYSPAFKRALLVEALGTSRSSRASAAFLKYGGAAMLKGSLKNSFCDDIKLLPRSGLLPDRLTAAVRDRAHARAAGARDEFIDGIQRITVLESDVKVVEMVLSGGSTASSSPPQHGRRPAMGLSGKDGRQLLRAKLSRRHGERDLGQVGEITAVNADVLEMLLGRGFIPGDLADRPRRRRPELQHQRRRRRRRDREAAGRQADLPDRRGRRPRRRRRSWSGALVAELEASSAAASPGACARRPSRRSRRSPPASRSYVSTAGAAQRDRRAVHRSRRRHADHLTKAGPA